MERAPRFISVRKRKRVPACTPGNLFSGYPGFLSQHWRTTPDSSRGSPRRAEDSAWPVLLRTFQTMADALSYHLDKMDVQVEILSSVATYVACIDKRIVDLNNLIKRAQEVTNDLLFCNPRQIKPAAKHTRECNKRAERQGCTYYPLAITRRLQ
ncbi:hypothetical protein NDU88_009842 [Pleurodeles waltl]|uniref:Uncharacterized protein n=1 Tax=Pleurodeles waltl TaxID=8319 RepID=A0AAV7PTL2_PLEWA|nr:hypothetical protein NDU88_009842 [Pleurodeles waltl]